MRETKLKICGLSRDCDIAYVNEVLPEYAGFVFADSSRQVSPEQAAVLRSGLHPAICPVGVFVNAKPELIRTLFHEGVIAAAQLHGEEPPSYVAALKETKGLFVIKAVRVTKDPALQFGVKQYEEAGADYLLFDQGTGGTGIPFDWSLLPETAVPFFLAGGLQEDNIEEAVHKTMPYAVDVSSGVETDGRKDPDKIRRLVRKIRKEV